MKRVFWSILWVLAVLPLVLLVPMPVEAATSQNVTVTASGYICGLPGDFTLTYIDDFNVGISWTVPPDAVSTMVRASYGRVPADRTDGYQVYLGAGNSCTDTGASLAQPDAIYYRAWSQNALGVWTAEFSSGTTESFMSLSILFAILVGIGLFMTWFSSRRRDILISLGAGLVWLALALWILIGNVTNLGMDKSWTVILVWVFVMMTFIPFLMYMNAESRHEASIDHPGLKGRISWSEWGADVQDQIRQKPDSYEDYKQALRKRLRR